MTNIIIANTKFNKLTFIEFVEKRTADKHLQATFLCECGEEKVLSVSRVKNGYVKSCGCLRRIVSKEKATTHGERHHPLYSVHNSMMNRCYNENNKDYPLYGSRGITVCKRWHNIKNFIKDMKNRASGTSIDRVDNEGNYCLSNCRWATSGEQARNKRCSVIYDGENAVDASIRLGGCTNLIATRKLRGWSLEKSFNTLVTKTR